MCELAKPNAVITHKTASYVSRPENPKYHILMFCFYLKQKGYKQFISFLMLSSH
jgi:hypothetical protein